MICPRCSGAGRLHGQRCHVCAGSGTPSWGRARTSDPSTSHEAARSVSARIRVSQEAVLTLLRERGPLSDEQLVELYDSWRHERTPHAFDRYPAQSPSGLRTRRAELVERELVVDTGRRVILHSGRRAIVWAAADTHPKGER